MKGILINPSSPLQASTSMGLAQKAWKRDRKIRECLELGAITKSNSPHPRFANSPDRERSFVWSAQVHLGQWEGRNLSRPLNCPSHCPPSPLTLHGSDHDVHVLRGVSWAIPVVSLTLSQHSWVCTWKIFLAWYLFNNYLKEGTKIVFGPWRKVMIKSRGG